MAWCGRCEGSGDGLKENGGEFEDRNTEEGEEEEEEDEDEDAYEFVVSKDECECGNRDSEYGIDGLRAFLRPRR